MYACGAYNNFLIFIVTIFGYLLHDLLTHKISSFINFIIKDNFSNSFKQSIYDLIKYSTIFFIQNMLLNLNLDLSLNWFITNYSMIFGFIIFNYYQKYIPIQNNLKLNNILFDNIRVTTGYIIQFFFIGKYNYLKNLSEITAYVIYHLISKKNNHLKLIILL